MRTVDRKTEIEPLSCIPEKRMFWSIISDYDLKTGLCELIDNALDIWMAKSPRGSVSIDISLDTERQLIAIRDNAGGVRHEDLRVLVSPGGSRNDPEAQSIGIFGVGSKRAVVALAEQIVIKTRFARQESYQIDITSEWLESPSWDMPAYRIPDIAEGQTLIELSHLRRAFTSEDIAHLIEDFGFIYNWFLQIEGCFISINGISLKGQHFEYWAYPPQHEARIASFELPLVGHSKVGIEITAGLIRDRKPDADNYGVYFYCNNRLIVKELKTRELGYYVTSEAGVPHPDASLCRVIVKIAGQAKLMPWNSSKTGINFNHPIFEKLRPTIIPLVSHFSSLSRRTKDDWNSKVFQYDKGELVPITPSNLGPDKKLILPPLPLVKRSHSENLRAANKGQINNQPWTLGLVEGVAAIDVVIRQKLQTKNRIALILLDSNFEIALKEFIVHRDDLFPSRIYNDAKIADIFSKRHKVISEIQSKITIPKALWDRANHYYRLRNKLIHERATVDITDADIDNYRDAVEKVLGILFGLVF